ncbi:MAG TPA: tRNA pseudouridine(55) synthase TruB, partial [Rectinemataceae bacterium]|nr:tRNA pseudouridine(55) synthase TruB [Rectinemataceae bacterium]
MCLINKPVGLTSFAALAAVKRSLATSRVGHAGTLDRFASGLLIAFSGSYCRLAGFAEAGEKVYRGRIAFGRETSTLDPEGETVAEGPIPDPGKLASALESFRGPIVQRPPLYSAVHIDGRRAYERARAGEVPVMPERRVTILELRLESYAMGVA